MDIRRDALEKHALWAGKIETKARIDVSDRRALSLAYTPGVAEPCLAIRDDPEKSFDLTRRWNTVAVVTDGSAVLGLGDIGPEAGMPVMEGKCLLFKAFGGVDAVPLCIASQETEEIVRTVALLQGSFGGINLEDIAAPRCFEIEAALKEKCSIPVFHDDQHGTAIVVAAAMQNAVSLCEKTPATMRVVINGIGAAGTAIARLLRSMGYENLVLCDKNGILSAEDPALSGAQRAMAEMTNPEGLSGDLACALRGADAFVGVSRPGLVTGDMVRSMAERAIVFGMANPVPEILPGEAEAAGAYIVGSGRSDYKNQINNLLAFPGVFRGAFDVRARDINEPMKKAAAAALAAAVGDRLSPDFILPDVFDKRVVPAMAEAVAKAALESGAARAPSARPAGEQAGDMPPEL